MKQVWQPALCQAIACDPQQVCETLDDTPEHMSLERAPLGAWSRQSRLLRPASAGPAQPGRQLWLSKVPATLQHASSVVPGFFGHEDLELLI